MTTAALYRFVEQLLPPLAVALLALATTAVVLARAYRGRRPRAAVIAAGTAYTALVYGWVHLRGLSAEERALAIRLAIVFLHFCILVYLIRVRPWLTSVMRRRRHL